MQPTATITPEPMIAEQDSVNLDWQQMAVTIKAKQIMSQAQNEQYSVVILGDIRKYQQPNNEVHCGAELLLEVLSCGIKDYYHNISGFFAAIIIDKRQNKLLLVTDHIGSIPLYFHHGQQEITIASSLSLLDKSDFELNPQAIFNYCYFHCIPAPVTIYRDVYKVECGHQVSFNQQGFIGSDLMYRPTYNYSNEPESVLFERCQNLVSQAVQRHASEESGAFLSGGLDSSTVAGMLAKTQQPAKTFSIGFDQTEFDETKYALITAEHFGTEHQVYKLQPQSLIENFKQIAGYFDEPFGNSSAMAAFACATFSKSHGVSTLLAGDGGDEIFAGNERYAKQKVFEHFTNCPAFFQNILNGIFCNTPLKNIPIGRKAASYIEQAKMGMPDRLESYNFTNRFSLNEMFCDDFLAQIDPKVPLQQKQQRYHQAASTNQIEQMLFLDWKFTLADNDLVKVSKMCEMAGVKVKYPLLEKELVDFSTTISPQQKLPGQQLRDFYKKSFSNFLAPATLSKAKHGFGLPFGLWMEQSEELLALASTTLAQLSQRNIIKPEFIEQVQQMHQSDHASYYGELLWILVVLELWLEGHNL